MIIKNQLEIFQLAKGCKCLRFLIRMVCRDQLAFIMHPPNQQISLYDFLKKNGVDMTAILNSIDDYQRLIEPIESNKFQHFEDPYSFVEEAEYRDGVEICWRVLAWQSKEIQDDEQ